MLDEPLLDLRWIADRLRQHVGDDRDDGRADGSVLQCRGHGVSCGLHQRAMEGGRNRQRHRAAHAELFSDLRHAIDRRLVAREHYLGRLVVVGHLADVALRRRRGDLARGVDADAEQRRHRALPDRHRGLHGLTSELQEPRSVGERESSGGGKG